MSGSPDSVSSNRPLPQIPKRGRSLPTPPKKDLATGLPLTGTPVRTVSSPKPHGEGSKEEKRLEEIAATAVKTVREETSRHAGPSAQTSQSPSPQAPASPPPGPDEDRSALTARKDAEKTKITDDKKKIAKGALEAEGRDHAYFVKRIVDEKDGFKRKERMKDIVVPLLKAALQGQSDEFVDNLPKIVSKFTDIDPDFLTSDPETFPLLAEYIADQATKGELKKFLESNPDSLPSPATVSQALGVFNKFPENIPPYEPTKEWADKADEYLKATNALGLAASNLGITREKFVEAAEKRLLQFLGKTPKVMKNLFVKGHELEKIALSLSPERLREDGYKNFTDRYRDYQERVLDIHKFLAQEIPSQGNELDIQGAPHARFLSEYRKSLEESVINDLRKVVWEGKAAYLKSEEMLGLLEKGKEYIGKRIEELRWMSPEKRREIIFGDSIKEGLRTVLGGLLPDLLEAIEDDILTPLLLAKRKEVVALADSLEKQYDEKKFADYEGAVVDLLLLLNVRYSGKYDQHIDEGAKSWLDTSLNDPLSGKRGTLKDPLLSAVKKFSGDINIKALHQNLKDFELRVKKGKTPEYYEAEMKKAFQGFASNARSKVKLCLDFAGRFAGQIETLAKEAQDSVDEAAKGALLVRCEALKKAQEFLRAAAKELQNYETKIYDRLSPETREKLKNPLANRPVLFGEDRRLTPRDILELVNSRSVETSIALLESAAECVKESDQAAHENIVGLPAQVKQWFRTPLKDIISSCGIDERMRNILIKQYRQLQ